MFYVLQTTSTTTNMVKPITDSDGATREQLASEPAQIPTHPSEEANLPPPNIIPDGVSPPIRHPLDPLNAG